MPPPDTPATTSSRLRHSRLMWLVAALLLIIAATALQGYLHWYYDFARDDGSPLEGERRNAPYITSPDPVVQEIVRLAELSSDDLVYDLGCGDGRIVIAAASASGCRGVGFDIDPERVEEARENVRLNQLQGLVEIKQQDLFTVDLREADVVVMYLLPWMLKKLIPQFDQMRPGTRIISHDFRIAGCQPDETVTVHLDEDRGDSHYVHLWVLPLKKGTAPK